MTPDQEDPARLEDYIRRLESERERVSYLEDVVVANREEIRGLEAERDAAVQGVRELTDELEQVRSDGVCSQAEWYKLRAVADAAREVIEIGSMAFYGTSWDGLRTALSALDEEGGSGCK